MTLSLPKGIAITEVGPRDGLQSLPNWVATELKVRIIDRLSDLGLPTIEVSSFGSPRAVPNLRDAEEVFARIRRDRNITYRGLVPNARGAQRAIGARVDEMAGLITASNIYTARNQGMTIEDAIEQNLLAFRLADQHGVPFVMAVGMAFWCAYEGQIPEERVVDIIRRLHNGGIRRFYLAGSLGMEDPVHVSGLFRQLCGLFPTASFGFHIHNLSGMATANILAALDAGVLWLESAICGLGGGIAMPATIGPVGNFPTEDLVTMLAEMGLHTGVSVDDAIAASRQIAALLGVRPQSHRANGAARKEVLALGKSNPLLDGS